MYLNMSKFDRPQLGHASRKERGMALILVLLTLLLLSAIGLGMMYMSDTDTAVSSNYRDTQVAFFAMRAGLEEARDRMRSSSAFPLVNPPTSNLPATMPGNPASILYITNPSAGEVVDPVVWTPTNAYFDDEFCHENFVGSPLAFVPPGPPCGATQGPPPASVVTVASIDPNTGTAASMKYKWVRITLKQNGTFANANPANRVDFTQNDDKQICYETIARQQIPVNLVPGGPFASCAVAQAAGADASPVYVVTALAVTPQGSRRIGQYEVAAFSLFPPAGALGLDGPTVNFSQDLSSDKFNINGNDSGAAGYTATGGVGTCVPSGPASEPAISTGGAAAVTAIDIALTGGPTIGPDRTANYTGAPPPAPAPVTPSVVNAGSTATGGTGAYSGEWASPANLDNLVNNLANYADVTYPKTGSCPCSPTGWIAGTNAAPQITFVNGDFNLGAGSGAGVLIVTGTLSFTGNASFNGLVLVIGQGNLQESGGGNGGFNGTVFVATTHSSPFPGTELAVLGTPTYNFSGGGNSYLHYNSCWSRIGNTLSYGIIAMREEMY